MSFDLICQNCGAPSGPSVGVCPFCKGVLSDAKIKQDSTVTQLKKFYAEGALDKALLIADKTYKSEKQNSIQFLLLYTKLLIETEAPAVQVRHVLADAFTQEPDNTEVADYMELVDAKFRLETNKIDDLGEQTLKNILRRSPQNVHAMFLLGAHLFWAEGDTVHSVKLLQKCVSVHPKFLRAWACLGAIFRQLGRTEPATHCFQQCLKLERNPMMKKYFESQCQQLRAA